MTDKTMMLLGLALKQVGGSLVIDRQTFMDIKDNYEIMVHRNPEQNVLLTLVEDEKSVLQIRANRASEQAKQRIIVP